MARRDSSPTVIALERLPKAALTRESLRETLSLARYVRPYRRRFFAGLATLFFSAGCGLAFPLLAGALIDTALRPGGASLPLLGTLSLNEVALILVSTVTLQALASFNSSLAFNRVGQSALADLRRECYQRLIALPMAFFGQRRVGELTSRVSTDVAQIEGALIDAMPQLCRQAVFLLGGITLIAVTSGRLTAVMLATLPVLIAAAVFLAGGCGALRGKPRTGWPRPTRSSRRPCRQSQASRRLPMKPSNCSATTRPTRACWRRR